MRKLSKVKWTWNHGKVFSEIEYEDGNKQIRTNDHPPPTKACHDIAHFICGFNGNLEWDYENEYNHIAEYNAVFVEALLDNFSHYYYHDYPINIEESMIVVDDHMKWFAEEYYKIRTDHPSKKNYIQLKRDFFEKINIDIICKYFLQFYQTWLIEKLCGSENFDLSIVMDSTIDYDFKPLYDYLIESKKVLFN